MKIKSKVSANIKWKNGDEFSFVSIIPGEKDYISLDPGNAMVRHQLVALQNAKLISFDEVLVPLCEDEFACAVSGKEFKKGKVDVRGSKEKPKGVGRDGSGDKRPGGVSKSPKD